MRLLQPIHARLLTVILLVPGSISVALAWDFLYLEQSLDLAILESVTTENGGVQGVIGLTHQCESCPQTFSFGAETRLDTPFGDNRPLSELTGWQGHPVSLFYSLPDYRITLLEVLPLSALQSAGGKIPQ